MNSPVRTIYYVKTANYESRLYALLSLYLSFHSSNVLGTLFSKPILWSPLSESSKFRHLNKERKN